MAITCELCKRAAPKKIPETDAIFDRLAEVNTLADEDESILRVSLDAKASILIGDYSRRGQSRVIIKALDHDFGSEERLTPFGITLPQYGEVHLYFTSSKITSDFIVDVLQDFWDSNRHRFSQVHTLLLNLDNGPENHSRRTQFMNRLTHFADTFHLTVELAYYPPYHSKYNPIERVWGVLEKHWNGSLLDTPETVLKFAQSMTYRGQHPIVTLVKTVYQTGVKLSQKDMKKLEERFERLPELPKWFVRIQPVFG